MTHEEMEKAMQFIIEQQAQFAVDIHPRTNIAVLADSTNNRVLLVPIPR